MKDNTPLTEEQIAYLESFKGVDNRLVKDELGFFNMDNEEIIVVKKDQSFNFDEDKINGSKLVEAMFNFDIDSLEEAKNSDSEVVPIFKDFVDFDSWLNEEPTKLPRGLTREEKRKHIIDSNKKGED
jgi:hypothetical protein